MRQADGSTYEGMFNYGIKEGTGAEIYPNGDTYVGHFRNGQPDGYGKYLSKNGDMYLGNFNQGKRHGKGKWTCARIIKEDKLYIQRSQYTGDVESDTKTGKGQIVFSSGGQYEGDFVNNKRHGFGRMIWCDGTVYEGQWVDGLAEGEGKVMFPDGLVKQGTFKENQLVVKHEEALDKSVFAERIRNLTPNKTKKDTCMSAKPYHSRRHLIQSMIKKVPSHGKDSTQSLRSFEQFNHEQLGNKTYLHRQEKLRSATGGRGHVFNRLKIQTASEQVYIHTSVPSAGLIPDRLISPVNDPKKVFEKPTRLEIPRKNVPNYQFSISNSANL